MTNTVYTDVLYSLEARGFQNVFKTQPFHAFAIFVDDNTTKYGRNFLVESFQCLENVYQNLSPVRSLNPACYPTLKNAFLLESQNYANLRHCCEEFYNYIQDILIAECGFNTDFERSYVLSLALAFDEVSQKRHQINTHSPERL